MVSFYHSFYIFQLKVYSREEVPFLSIYFKIVYISKSSWILIFFLWVIDPLHYHLFSCSNYPQVWPSKEVLFDMFLSFLGYVLTFWHIKLFQAHLLLPLPQPPKSAIPSRKTVPFLGEWCVESKFLELVVTAIRMSLLLVGRAICIRNTSVSACTHIKIHRCLLSLIAIKSMGLPFYLPPFSFETPFSDTENSSPCIFNYLHNPRIYIS